MGGTHDPEHSSDARSSLVLRTIELPGRRTSFKLEPLMWAALDHVCAERNQAPGDFIAEVEGRALASSLTSALRVALLEHFWRASALRESCDGKDSAIPPMVGPRGKPGGKTQTTSR